jgi:ParB-like chromosome segregation protein Spo0J
MTTARLLDVPAVAIRLSLANPRTDGEADLEGLAASVGQGLAQRPTLVEVQPGVFEVLTGERRVRAGIAAGWEMIPAIVEDPLDPIDAHTRRISENLHRRDLNPLDEARALKLDWLNANAAALGLADQANAALAQAGSVQAGLVAVAAVLAAAEWSPSRPAVTQEDYLKSRGLGISKAMLRKKLQVLNLSAAAEERLDRAGLTEAGLRAFLRLEEADQSMLLDAIDADPELAKETRTIVQWVGDPKKGRTMRDAIAIARGEVPAATSDPGLVPTQSDARDFEDTEDDEERDTDTGSERGAPIARFDEQAAAELVLPLMETAQALQGQLDALAGVDLTQLPEPWDGFAREALITIQTAIQPLT